MQEDKLILGGCSFSSRFILGSGKYSLPLIKAAAEQAGAQIITLALAARSIAAGQYPRFYSLRHHTAAQHLRRPYC